MEDANRLPRQPAANTRELLKNTLGMAWPAVLESFFIALAGMIDVKMVSNLGSYAVAAVGLTTQPKFLGLAFFIATNVALSALVARRLGEKRREDANQVMITALVMSILVCAVISTLCVTLANPIIDLCGSQPDTHAAAVTYFRIIMGGIIFGVVSMTINAALRGSGNTRIAMTTNVTSSVLNICGNYLLIEGHFGFPALGIAGAAIATVFGTVVACGMSIFSLRHPDGFVSLPHIIKAKIRPAWKSVRELFHLSGNILVENLLMRVGFIATALVAASLGTDVMAAHQVGMNVLTISFAFGDGMQVAAVALTGRSLGEGQKEIAKTYGHLCQRIGITISLILAILFVVFGRWFYGLYFPDEPHIVEYGVEIMRFSTLITFFQISSVIYMGCLRAAGDVKYTLFASVTSITVVRTAFTCLLVLGLHWGLTGVWLGVLTDQACRLILAYVRFRQGHWVDLKI